MEPLTNSSNRINWISILRGLIILLVVMNHVQLLDASTGECYGFITEINNLFVAIRMPSFVMISGLLLYLTRMSKEWTTLNLYKDKLIRIGLPLIFCTCVGTLMQIAFNGIVKSPHPVDFFSFLRSFVVIKDAPWPHRWYLMTLLSIMALYPLFMSVKSKIADYTILATLILTSKIDFTQFVNTNWFYIFSINRYLPFFYLGIVTCKYGWWKKLESKLYFAVPISIFAYATLMIADKYWQFNEYLPLCELAGITASVSVCLTLSHTTPNIFHTFRNYIFQIYLFGIVFQAFVELILWRHLGCPASLVVVFYILNVASGIYMPVFMSKIVEKIPCKFVRLCFGLT